jgi:hypothetical protein
VAWGAASPARAQNDAGEAVPLDRAVVRFISPETGGAASPRFIFERVLAFEARIEALSDPDRPPGDQRPYRERDVRAALERHIAETLLASARIDPEPSEADVDRAASAARLMLTQRVGGPGRLERAAQAEGIDQREVLRILRREARASLYLDRMVEPMLAPSDAELRNIHRTVSTPFRGQPYDKIKDALRRWYVTRRMSAALSAYYQNARSRVQVTFLTGT